MASQYARDAVKFIWGGESANGISKFVMMGDTMGCVRVLISNMALYDLRELDSKHESYWIEPEAPPDLKIINCELLADRDVYEVTFSSKTFLNKHPIPFINLIIHRGKKPSKSFIFR